MSSTPGQIGRARTTYHSGFGPWGGRANYGGVGNPLATRTGRHRTAPTFMFGGLTGKPMRRLKTTKGLTQWHLENGVVKTKVKCYDTCKHFALHYQHPDAETAGGVDTIANKTPFNRINVDGWVAENKADECPTEPKFTVTGLVNNGYINSKSVTYSINKNLASGTIVYNDGGTAQTYHLSSTDCESGSHTIDTGFSLVNDTIYTIIFNGVDLQGNHAPEVKITDVTYDNARPLFTTTLVDDTHTNNNSVTCTINEKLRSGTIEYLATAGTDTVTRHIYTLKPSECAETAQQTIDTGLSLVDGSTYTVTFNGVDLAGNNSYVLIKTGIFYDTVAPVIDTLELIDNNTGNPTITFNSDSAGTIQFVAALPGGLVAKNSANEPIDHTTTTSVQSGSNTIIFSGTPHTYSTGSSIKFKVIDAAGNESAHTPIQEFTIS